MTLTKLRMGTFKHIEAELYDYHDTLKQIEVRREELMSDKPKEEGMPSSKSLPSSPTEKYATRLVDDRRLQELERVAKAVGYVYSNCDDPRKALIRLRYWTKPQTKTWEGIAQELHISRRQAFRFRDEIVYAIGEKLGWR